MAGRFYEPVALCSFKTRDSYGVRAKSGDHHHRVMGRELGLNWDRADRLCDLLEDVRRNALAETDA